MRFNPHAFKRLTEPPPVSATDSASASSASSVPAKSPADSGPDAVSAAFICAYGRPGANHIPVPEGSMAVTPTINIADLMRPKV